MAICGHDYDKAFMVSWNRKSETFDSAECAAVRIVPECAHGARDAGHRDLADRAAG